jgi:hypothetical protein
MVYLLKMVIFHGKLLNNQMVKSSFQASFSAGISQVVMPRWICRRRWRRPSMPPRLGRWLVAYPKRNEGVMGKTMENRSEMEVQRFGMFGVALNHPFSSIFILWIFHEKPTIGDLQVMDIPQMS